MKSLSRGTSSEVFILGAGFSKWLSATMPLLRDLAADVLGDAGLMAKLEKKKCKRLVERLDLEAVLTLMSASFPWKSANELLEDRIVFRELVGLISAEIETAEDDYVPQDADQGQMLSEYMFAHRSTVVSFNYDTVLERLLNHGRNIYSWVSFWRLPIRNVDERASSDVDAPLGGGGAYMPDFIDPSLIPEIVKVHGSRNWLFDDMRDSVEQVYFVPEDYSGRRIMLTATGLSPLIVPPITDKASYSNNYVIVGAWRRARKAIRSAKRLVFFGYSLPDTDLHFRVFLETNVRPLTEIVVVNRDNSSTFVAKWKSMAEYLGCRLGKMYLGADAGDSFCREICAPNRQ